ncbi:hypothetical protein Tco_0886879 [Tanacetum coccineum]
MLLSLGYRKRTLKDTVEVDINSLLDIQIQQVVSKIQSSSILTVPVLVIPEPTILLPIPKIITTALPKAPFVIAIITTTIPTPITTSLSSPPITNVALVPESKAFSAIKIKSQVPSAVNDYLGSSLGDALQKVLQKHIEELKGHISQKDASKIIQAKQEHGAKEQLPRQSAKPYDQVAEAEFKQKKIIFNMMRESKSYEKHSTHKALYDALMLSMIQGKDEFDRLFPKQPNQRKRLHEDKDKDPSTGSNQRKRKRISGKDPEPSKPSSASKKASKGNNPPKSFRTGKSASAAEIFNKLITTEKDLLMFDELMATPIDFSKFAMHRLKIDKLTQADLVDPVYKLLNGTCQSSIELEYNKEECY